MGSTETPTPSRLQAYPEHKCSHQYHSRGHVRLQTIGIGYGDADFVTQVHASGTLGAGRVHKIKYSSQLHGSKFGGRVNG